MEYSNWNLQTCDPSFLSVNETDTITTHLWPCAPLLSGVLVGTAPLPRTCDQSSPVQKYSPHAVIKKIKNQDHLTKTKHHMLHELHFQLTVKQNVFRNCATRHILPAQHISHFIYKVHFIIQISVLFQIVHTLAA